ncbi:Farnesyl diphosphate synthase [bacterium HR36]|nr:Farnesyl diphosphate synthase [bacterium HR36]
MNDWPFSELRQLIDSALEQYLAPQRDVPGRLRDAMHYSLLGPGKRVRPLVVLLASQACSGECAAALPAACAVEMVHAYSLIHDDLPAMDDDDLRRGRPTCHRQFDEATAILAGDALLTLAFEVLTQLAPAALARTCIGELARAAGMAGMVGGQMDDLLAERQQLSADLSTLQHIHQRKTAALFRAATRLGGLIATWDLERTRRELFLAALDEYGAFLGLAFQIADDLLDVEGQEQQTGKRVGKDARRGKLTFPGLLGVAGARQHLMTAYDRAIAALAPLGSPADGLRQLAHFVVQRHT